MPARNSSMELSSPSNPDIDGSVRPSRRKSGRTAKVPEYFSPSQAGAKRKHNVVDDDGDEVSEASEDESQESDGQADEEEVREQKRKARKTQPAKPVQKRAKPNGIGGALPMRTAAAGPKKTRRTFALNATRAENAGDLYTQVFGEEASLDEVAAQWTARFNDHQSQALQELINLVLKAAGCEQEVETYDVEDPDHAAEKLTEIIELFQKQNVADYPIIAKTKASGIFKRTLTSFFETLILVLDTTELLYNEPDLIENMSVWIASMSSASHRALRHTATIVALSIVDGLCTIGRRFTEKEAKLQRQSGGEEKKKAKVNRARVKDLKEQISTVATRRATLDDITKDWYDTVFVHRYRDIDAKIRHDCIIHLSNWINTYVDHFLDGAHLRYLGWLLSDPYPQPRHEVVKQLLKMYKDANKTAALGYFTERFKERFIEMATRDAEPGIRATVAEMLEVLREYELLDPDDIDPVGRLIFDAEPRVRKAIVPFFAAAVQDTLDDKIEALGGARALKEDLPAVDAEDFEGLRVEWLKYRSLAELLHNFDPEDTSPIIERGLDATNDVLIGAGIESRFSLAAQAFFPKIKELSDWQVLAGYLLFDSSQEAEVDTSDVEARFKSACKLTEKEEAILLDVLNVCVQFSVTDVLQEGKNEKTKKTKKELQILNEKQEEAAQSLALLIPKLLKKFGAASEAASAVLRLQRTLNLDVFQELREDSTTYAALLDDIQKQFMSHKTSDVLSEASNALLHARAFPGVGEITDEKLRSIWDDTAYALITHCRGENLETRGGIDTSTLLAVSSTVLRLSSLARVSDCVDAFETPKTYIPTTSRRKKNSTDLSFTPINLLLTMLSRGEPGSHIDPDVSIIEDELVTTLISALLTYFLWASQRLQSTPTSVTDARLISLASYRDHYASALADILHTRHASEPLRLAAAEALLDLHTLLTIQLDARTPSEALKALSQPLPLELNGPLLATFAAVEHEYAKAARVKLEDPSEDEEPEDLSDDDDDDEAGEEVEGEDEAETQARVHRATMRHRSALLAEDRLCGFAGKIVLAIISSVVDPPSMGEGSARRKEGEQHGPVRTRLCRNKARLGQNFKEVAAALERPVARAKKGKAGAAKERKGRVEKTAKSKEIVEEDEDDDGDSRMADVEDEEEMRRRGLVVDEEIARRDVADKDGEADEREESVVGD